MKIKKLLALVLAGAMTATLLVGCGGSSTTTTADTAAETTTDSADTTTADTTEATTEASGDLVNINVTRATFNLASPDSAQVQKVQDAVNEYIKDKINVQITLTDIGSGEFTDKANLALANNEINLLWTASWESTIGTNDLVPNNAVYDITDLLPGTPCMNLWMKDSGKLQSMTARSTSFLYTRTM